MVEYFFHYLFRGKGEMVLTIEIRPLGVTCNLACTYCYQEPMRQAGNIHTKYDIDKIIEQVEKTGQQFNLFGGEALLVPKKDLETFFKYGYEKFGGTGVQTNGTLIDNDHIEMFLKYNVNVGISIDGANELNGLRKVRGRDSKTLEATQTIVDNIGKLASAGVSMGIIITLHRENGSPERLPRLMNFIRWLGDIGVKGGNIHKLEVDKTMPDQEKHVLTQDENIWAFTELAKFFDKPENQDLNYNPFNDYEDAIVKSDFSSLTCYLNRCDPMNTQAVYGIEGDGALSNCGRTNKEGIDWYKADDTSYERYISLYHTPPELNGCQGCRFFMVCSGSCVGEGVDSDFRNKTTNCKTMKAMFGYYEDKAKKLGITPWTKKPNIKELESIMINSLMNKENTNVENAQSIANRKRVIPVMN